MLAASEAAAVVAEAASVAAEAAVSAAEAAAEAAVSAAEAAAAAGFSEPPQAAKNKDIRAAANNDFFISKLPSFYVINLKGVKSNNEGDKIYPLFINKSINVHK